MRFAHLIPLCLVSSVSLLNGCASTAVESESVPPPSAVQAAAPAPAPFTAQSKSLSLEKPALEREIVGIRVFDGDGSTGDPQAVAVDNAPTVAKAEANMADNAPAPVNVPAAAPQFPVELVAKIQANLSRHGFDVGTPDGVFGKNTRDAIRAYQQFHDVPVTGEPSSALLKSLLSE